MLNESDRENLELNLLLEAIHGCYGYDFRNYARASLLRRVKKFRDSRHLESISELIPKVINDRDFFLGLVHHFSITVTEMFRDPSFYKIMIDRVFSLLSGYPYIRIWHAGCATGEEVYSTVILLKEAGLYDRCTVFATDFNDSALETARNGAYRIGDMKECISAYHAAGGSSSFSEYFTANDDCVQFSKDLRKNITFANHNLVLDGIFGEMQLILCRNVLIYFNRELQNRVLNLLYGSLQPGGFLCLGSKESIAFSSVGDYFTKFDEKERIFQKRYSTDRKGMTQG